MRILYKLCLSYSVYCLVFTQNLFAAEKRVIGIIGDSLATGAATHPSLTFDPNQLWDILKGQVELEVTPVPPNIEEFVGSKTFSAPLQLEPGVREFRSGFEWLGQNIASQFSNHFFNTQEYSWGYLLSRKLNYAAENTLIAGENGARIGAIKRQSDRLLDQLQGKLPNETFILFSGNDLCAPHPSFMTSELEWEQALFDGLRYLVVNGEPAAEGSEINVLAFLNISQLLVGLPILEKKVNAFGQETTCRALRQQSYLPVTSLDSSRHSEIAYMGHVIPPSPARYCPSLFSLPLLAKSELGMSSMFSSGTATADQKKSNGDRDSQESLSVRNRVDEMFGQVATRVRQYRSASSRSVNKASQWAAKNYPEKKIKIRYLRASESLQFLGDDIAQDCFHLSHNGQLKLAQLIFDDLSVVKDKSKAPQSP